VLPTRLRVAQQIQASFHGHGAWPVVDFRGAAKE
jgi:hypothetical protein